MDVSTLGVMRQAKWGSDAMTLFSVTIKHTLGGSETGIVFMGAYHDILSELPDYIHASQIKDVARVDSTTRHLPT